MDDEAEKVVNITGMPAKEWEKARGIATRNGEKMGSYVGRALAQLAEREAGERFFPPERYSPSMAPDSLPSIPPSNLSQGPDIREIASLLLAMKEAGIPIQKRVQRQLNTLIHRAIAARIEP